MSGSIFSLSFFGAAIERPDTSGGVTAVASVCFSLPLLPIFQPIFKGVRAMSEFTKDECAYMDYLDEVYCDDYGRLQKLGDPIAFSVGLNEWLRAKEATSGRS